MRAGELRHEVQFQENTNTTPDAAGHVLPGWTTFRTVRAKIDQQGGREFERAKAMNSEVTDLLTVYYDPSLTTQHQIIHKHSGGERTLSILRVNNMNYNNRVMQILAKESR